MKIAGVWFITSLIGPLCLCMISCKSEKPSTEEPSPDSGIDSGPDPSQDAAPDDAAVVDAGEGKDGGTKQPGDLGKACWNEDVFEQWHPNYGLPGCESALKCIGNEQEAWCTESCGITGEINGAGGGIDGFCCGELASPCDPQRYWLPQSMGYYCIPRQATLADTCDLVSDFQDDATRCAPACSEGEELFTTKCAPLNTTHGFCTFPCDPANGDADCLIEPAFEGGCCGEIMGGNWCLTPELCQ